jgi:signal transduction histidine kinase
MTTRPIFSEEGTFLRVKRPGFEHIRKLAVLLPALYVGLFEFLRHQWLEPILPGWLSIGWLGNMMAALVVAALVYLFVRFFTNKLQESASELSRACVEAAVVVERQRIAREMHDSIAQTLFYLTVELGEVEDLILAGQSTEAKSELRTAREEIRAAHHQVRAVITDLKQQAELEDFGEAVRRTATELAERLGMQVTCEVTGRVALPVSSRQHVLAIIQEALINAQQHSSTQHATIRLKAIEEDAIVEVSDEGVGFDPTTTPREERYGLAIMEERAQIAGGQLGLDSLPGHGTRVTVHLPGAKL